MVKIPTRYLTQETLHKLLDPGRVFYRVAVDDILARGEHAEIQSMLQGAKAVKEQYGDLDKLIGKLESALKKAQG
jgi:hypothetical protein